MSKIKLEGNASGTGTLTISAPNTNTDRTLTLPDGAGEILTDASTLSSSNLSGALPALDGSALTGISGGKVLQVVQTATTSGTSSTSSTWAATNLTLNITPSSTSSKVYVSVSGGMNGWAGSAATTDQRGGLKIYRKIGSGSFAELESSQSGQQVQYSRGGVYMPLSINYLDSPATTSQVTYTLYMRRESGTLTFSVIRDNNNQGQIIAMEIAG